MEPADLPLDDGSTSLSRFWDSIVLAGPVAFAGLLAIVLALALLVGSPYLARRSRHFVLLVVAAVLIGAAGYVAFDCRYVMLNCGLHDPAEVRADCEKLLRASRAANGAARYLAAVADADFPASFQRLGADRAYATSDSVYINLGWDGYLYCPKASTKVYYEGRVRVPEAPMAAISMRRTVYRDFHYFRPFAE